jgi:hypothetical protein
MIGAITQIYTAFRGFFSQSFWYAMFVPVAMFASIHGLIATRFGWSLDLNDLFSDTGKYSKALIVVVAGLALAGYVLQSFVPLVRGLLDGSLLSRGLHDRLRKDRYSNAVRVRNEIIQALQTKGRLTRRVDDAKREQGTLLSAYRSGCALTDAADHAAIDAAVGSIKNLANATDRGDRIDLNLVETAQKDLVIALRANKSDLTITAPNGQDALRLRHAHEQFIELLATLESEAQYQWEANRARVQVADALDAPRATSLGDARYVVERYSRDVYLADFDFLWPRLLVMLRTDAKEDPSIAAIDAAQSRSDFAVMCMILTCSVPLVWLPAILAYHGPGWLLLVIGGSAPLALWLFYNMAVQAQLLFGETVKTTIDRHRLLVFKMLRQASPSTRGEERQLWRLVADAQEDGRTTRLTYVADRPGP